MAESPPELGLFAAFKQYPAECKAVLRGWECVEQGYYRNGGIPCQKADLRWAAVEWLEERRPGWVWKAEGDDPFRTLLKEVRAQLNREA